MSQSDEEDKKGPNIQGIASEILKRAVTLGAGAYVSAEDRVNKTLSSVQAPIHISKNVLRELLDSFFKNYSMQITAKVDFVRKNKSDGMAASGDEQESGRLPVTKKRIKEISDDKEKG